MSAYVSAATIAIGAFLPTWALVILGVFAVAGLILWAVDSAISGVIGGRFW